MVFMYGCQIIPELAIRKDVHSFTTCSLERFRRKSAPKKDPGPTGFVTGRLLPLSCRGLRHKPQNNGASV